MAQALEAYDQISSCQQLASEVAMARATGVDGTESFVSPAKGQQQGGAGSAGAAAAASPDFDVLGLGELQSALDSTAAATAQLQQAPAPAAAAVDPFMAVSEPFPSSPFLLSHLSILLAGCDLCIGHSVRFFPVGRLPHSIVAVTEALGTEVVAPHSRMLPSLPPLASILSSSELTA